MKISKTKKMIAELRKAEDARELARVYFKQTLKHSLFYGDEKAFPTKVNEFFHARLKELKADEQESIRNTRATQQEA